jgi:sentrin-specific protease 7
MPPLPGRKFFSNLGHHIGLSLFPSSEHAEDHNNDESHARARSEDMDDVVDQSSASTKKRMREAHEEQSPNTKKQKKFSREDGAFFGEYNEPTPKDACKVTVPTNEQRDEDIAMQSEKATKVVRAAKPMAGAHKTKNTLNNSQPGRIGGRPSVFAQVKPHLKTSNPVTRTSAREHVGDGFNDQPPTQETTPKRRATNGASQAPTKKQQIDMTGDSDDVTMGEVEAVNGNRVSSDSQNSVIEVGSHSPPKPDFFVPHEMRSANLNTNPPISKKRRQHSSAQGSTYNGSHNQMRPSSRHTNGSFEVDDLNTPASRYTKTTEPKSQKDVKPGRPEIDLGRGTDVKDIKAARDVKLLKGAMGSMRHPLEHNKHRARGLLEGRNGEDPTSVFAYTARHAGARPEEIAHEQEQRLSAKFHRVSNSPPADVRRQWQQNQHQIHHQQQQQPPRQSRAKAMQVTSSKGGSDAFEDSPDQLHTTSPNILRKPGASVPVTRESPRQHSPSEIKTTNFTSSTTNSASVPQPSRKAKKRSDPTEDAPVRIPVTQIWCRGSPCQSMENHPLELVWHEGEEAHFELEKNGQPVCVLGKDEIMSIGVYEARKLHYNKESTEVVLYGAESVGRSNGKVLLQFPDVDSRNDFINLIASASRSMVTTHENAGKMDNLFKTQAKALEADAGKYAIKVLEETDAVEDARQQAVRRNEIRQSSEDHIRYEAYNTTPSGQSGKSPYFHDQDHEPRKSTRQSKAVVKRSPTPDPVVERWTQVNPQTPWHQSVMYPATGARRITVDFQDLERLDEGEFLNDNIVGYALRRIEESMTTGHKSKVHFFNSYFFTSLTSKNGRKTFNYESVKKWTKQKDLFDIPYVVVPINENFHWYLAIICNLPSLKRKSAALDDLTSDAVATPSTSQQASARPSPIRDPVVPDSQDVDDNDKPDAQAMESLSIESERPSREDSEVIEFGEDGKVVSNNHDAHSNPPVQVKGGKKSKKRTAPALPKYPTNKPIIITLDSFGQAHTGQVASLKDYVAAEAMEKRGMEVGREDMKGMTATGVPLQQNFCDCGLYLVGYVAEFAKDPEGFVNKVLTRQLDGQSDFAAFDASKKRDEIRDDLLRLHHEQDAERLALKKAKKDSKNKVPMTAVTVTDASTSVASPGTRHSLGRAAQSIRTVEQSAQAPSTATTKAPQPPGKPRASNASPPDASDDDVMESGMPRALTSVKSPTPHTQIEDGEMLDNHHNDATEHRSKGMRKVLSPQLDGLSMILNAGPPAAPLHLHEKSPGSDSEQPSS